MIYLAGIDIGGTKCAVSIGKYVDENIEILDKIRFETVSNPKDVIDQLVTSLEKLLVENNIDKLESIGISCGGPLNSKKGLILSPPNLPNWDNIDIVTPFESKFGVPTNLQNDANACALAEWIWGAGKGSENMIFLTFGTGMGAGLILNGKLYSGTSDMAGEVGHIRLEDHGPKGYNKVGSFEGYCSGGGIAKLSEIMLENWNNEGKISKLMYLSKITTLDVANFANEGDELALEVFNVVGKKLGKGLSILIDLLNPEKIIIGSIFLRQEGLLRKNMIKVIEEEALTINARDCTIETPLLEEKIGDYAALSVAMNYVKENTVKL